MSAKKITDDGGTMTKDLMVSNKLGIHARPAAMFVKVANRYTCDIFVEKDGEKVNGKSIMGLMMLAAGPGSRLTVHAQGNDASAAIAELELLLHRKFDEE
ncbi:MAG: Phosphotransferase system, phosphocarrier protein HPr [Pedosphaera sp.]|nr:Phosphotransferase system, phosphocarrier protein HPr [Pedosphaera sp.]